MGLLRYPPGMDELYDQSITLGEMCADVSLRSLSEDALQPTCDAIRVSYRRAVEEVGQRKAVKRARQGTGWGYRLVFDTQKLSHPVAGERAAVDLLQSVVDSA